MICYLCWLPQTKTSDQSNMTKRSHRRSTWTVQSYTSGGAKVHSHVTQFLGPITQKASQLVQPFLYSLCQFQNLCQATAKFNVFVVCILQSTSYKEGLLAIASIRMVLRQRPIDNGVKGSLELHLEVLEQKLAALHGVIKRQNRQQAAMGSNFGAVMKKNTNSSHSLIRSSQPPNLHIFIT